MISKAYILPTGDEMREGVVLDTDSPMIMGELLRMNACCTITRMPPVIDEQGEIIGQIRALSDSGADLIILIGGSGGGHRHSPTLGRDFTHSGMEEILKDCFSTSLYGKNGHLWCKLVCGFLNKTLLINLPGPFVEAQAAIGAFRLTVMEHGLSPKYINERMAQAVKEQYPTEK